LKIKPEILEILSNCTIEKNILYLPPGQLDRKVYQQVKKPLILPARERTLFDENP